MKRAAQGLIALLLLWLVVRSLNVESLTASLGRLPIASVAKAALLFFVGCGLAVAKWRLLWQRATWWQMLNANFVAQFYSLALPGQLAGEVVKTLRIGTRFADTTNVATSVLVDRATGVLSILVLAIAGALFSTNAVAADAVVALNVMVMIILGVFYLVTRQSVIVVASTGLEFVGNRHRWFRAASQKFIELLSAWASLMAKPGTIVAAVCTGIAHQAVCVWINFTIATGLGVDIDFADWCWIFGLVSVALLLPITIAGIGVREASYVGLLGIFGVSIEDAVAVSVIVFGISLTGVLIGGVLELAHTRRTPRQLSG